MKCTHKSELIKLKLITWHCILCLACSFTVIFCRVIFMSLKCFFCLCKGNEWCYTWYAKFRIWHRFFVTLIYLAGYYQFIYLSLCKNPSFYVSFLVSCCFKCPLLTFSLFFFRVRNKEARGLILRGDGKFLEELSTQWKLTTLNNYTEHSVPSRISCQLRKKVDEKE